MVRQDFLEDVCRIYLRLQKFMYDQFGVLETKQKYNKNKKPIFH